MGWVPFSIAIRVPFQLLDALHFSDDLVGLNHRRFSYIFSLHCGCVSTCVSICNILFGVPDFFNSGVPEWYSALEHQKTPKRDSQNFLSHEFWR